MEDVQFLQQHAQVEEYVAFIDSAKRDKASFRTPSEYQVVWSTPFTNVFGIDVVQTALPKSGYTVNESNNTIEFRFHLPGYLDHPGYQPPPWLSATVTPGNHTYESLISTLNEILTCRENGRLQQIDVRPVSNPFELTNRLVFMSKDPFEFNLDESTIAPVVGFSQLLDVTNSHQIARFANTQSLDESLQVTMFEGATESNQSFPLTRGVYMRQLFYSSLSGTLSGLKAYIVPFGNIDSIDTRLNFSIINARTNKTVVWGEMEVQYPNMSVVDVSSVQVAPDVSDTFLLTESYWLEIRDDSNEDPNNCYKISYGKPDTAAAHGTLATVVNGVVEYWYEPGDVMAADVTVLPFNYVLVPPGVVNLAAAAPYVQLRCPEVEKHMYRNRAYEKWNLGLAAVTISKDNEFVATLPFTTGIMPQRRFHPISKLSRMTLRWENPDGSLHNFMGVDHTITLIIKYYAVPQAGAEHTVNTILNPHYNPDMLKYLNDNIYRDMDSDDEDHLHEPLPFSSSTLHRRM